MVRARGLPRLCASAQETLANLLGQGCFWAIRSFCVCVWIVLGLAFFSTCSFSSKVHVGFVHAQRMFGGRLISLKSQGLLSGRIARNCRDSSPFCLGVELDP